jgi:phosphoglycolate phosphatase-like HAD superfamily hydrolase
MMRASLTVACACALAAVVAAAADPLPSWNESARKTAILDFVERVTEEGSAEFVPGPERIAVFDNDGTLWVEQPVYAEVAFGLDRLRALAPENPEWASTQPFQAALEGDWETLTAGGQSAIGELIGATHAGLDTAEFERIVRDWLAEARHPRFDRPHTELVYQPMLELMAFLRGNGFKTFIVSGGTTEFLRPWTEAVYGVPPEQVVGTSIRTEFRMQDGEPVLYRLPEVDFVDDNEGKPVGINTHIGRRPIMAFGNSDGDSRDAAVDDHGRGAAARHAGPSHRRGAGVRLRPRLPVRAPRPGSRCGGRSRVDADRHGGGLGGGVSVRGRVRRPGSPAPPCPAGVRPSGGCGAPAACRWDGRARAARHRRSAWRQEEGRAGRRLMKRMIHQGAASSLRGAGPASRVKGRRRPPLARPLTPARSLWAGGRAVVGL